MNKTLLGLPLLLGVGTLINTISFLLMNSLVEKPSLLALLGFDNHLLRVIESAACVTFVFMFVILGSFIIRDIITYLWRRRQTK